MGAAGPGRHTAGVTARRLLVALAIVLLLPVLLLGALIAFAESEWAEGWIEGRVAQRIGRAVDLDEIDIELGWPPSVHLARLRIANPEWASTPSLVDAENLTARVGIPPLLKRRVVVPYFGAQRATAGLERSGDRATWRFDDGPDDSDVQSPLALGRLFVEEGRIAYRDAPEKTSLDLDVKGSLGAQGELTIAGGGRFRGEPAKVEARMPSLQPSPTSPVRVIGDATLGKTRISADGTLSGSFETLDVKLELSGATMKDLRYVFGPTLPDTPPYRIAGRLRHSGSEWVFDPFDGRVGDSDLAGTTTYRTGAQRPMLRGNLRSKLLDFDDLGPLVGAPPKTGPGETASAEQERRADVVEATKRALPTQRFSLSGLGRMDADVRLDAKRVLRPEELPIDALSMRILLDNALLKLDPLAFGIAGGRVAGPVSINAREKPARADLALEFQQLKLSQLFPQLESTRQSIGTLYGRAKLRGRGDSIAQLLGSSDGQVTLAIDGGRFSLLLVELLGIDIAEAVSLLGTRNRQVTLRCAVADLTVKDGIATPKTFVIDTSDTVVEVTGTIDFASEKLDLVFRAEPKDPSIFALRSPIHLEGSFADPKVRPEAGPIVARIAGAVALAAINPILALIPFIETGPGEDSDCRRLVAQARQKGAVKK